MSVIIPTYGRPDALRRCLLGLQAQHRAPEEVLVVHRPEDAGAEQVLLGCGWDAVLGVKVTAAGVVAALRAGVERASGQIIAVTDDDAVPRPDWLAGLLSHFAQPEVGLVGGRDILHPTSLAATPTARVGLVSRWGRMTGNHHRGAGPAHRVDVLKGVNFAARQEAFALPEGLRGIGAQAHHELATCRWARARGWAAVYDPAILVDHYPGPRAEGDERALETWSRQFDTSYNLVSALLCGDRRPLFRRAAYGLLVGDSDSPGLARGTLALIRGERSLARVVPASLAGQTAALLATCLGRGPAPVWPRLANRRPRVALVAHDVHDGGGMERVLAELVRRGSGRVEFVVVSASLTPALQSHAEWHRVQAPERPFPIKFVAFWFHGARALRGLRIDLVHTCGAIIPSPVDLASVHFCHAGAVKGIGRLSSADISLLRRLNTAIVRLLSVAAERWCYRPARARRLAAVSRGVAGELARHYPRVPLVLTPNGVDLTRFSPDEAARQAIRSRERVSADEVVLLFVGGDWGRKGLAVAIQALALARARTRVRLHLWVVGRGDEERFSRLGAAIGVGDAIRFFGRRADTETFYRAADVFVLPSSYEAFSLVAMEAAGCALPIVATNVGGLREVVGEDEAGFVVASVPTATADAVVRLAEDPALRRRMGERARERCRPLTWESSVDSVLDCYADLLDPAPGLRRGR